MPEPVKQDYECGIPSCRVVAYGYMPLLMPSFPGSETMERKQVYFCIDHYERLMGVSDEPEVIVVQEVPE